MLLERCEVIWPKCQDKTLTHHLSRLPAPNS